MQRQNIRRLFCGDFHALPGDPLQQSRIVPSSQAWEEHATLNTIRDTLEHMGTDYGGWVMSAKVLTKDSIVYSYGVGLDISWDIELISATGATVYGMDNTPRHMEWWNGGPIVPDKFHHVEYLLGESDGTMNMALPNGHGLSYSPLEASARGFIYGTHVANLPKRTVRSLMAELGHTRIDVMKWDVEGTEFPVLAASLRGVHAGDKDVAKTLREEHPLPCCQFLIEFHHRLMPKGYEAKAEALLHLQSLGFQLIYNVQHADGADNALLVNPNFC